MSKKKTAKKPPAAASNYSESSNSSPPVAATVEQLPGVAGGLAAKRTDPDPFDDAPPAGPDGEPLDRCKCGETAGAYRTIRETDRISGRDRAGKPYRGIIWGVVICAACGRRRPRKQFVRVVDEATDATTE